MLGQGHDGRGGGAICGHGVCDPAVSDPGLELSDGGGGGGDFRRSIDSFCQARLMGDGGVGVASDSPSGL